MTTTLGDVLLVLLAAEPGTAHDLQQRHRRVLGPRHSVDIKRVVATLTRQERGGFIRADMTLTRGLQRVWTLTDSGRRRQRSWLLGLERDAERDDVLVRVFLAVATRDRDTLHAVIGAGLATLEAQAPSAVPDDLAAGARAELEVALARATVDWLQQLRDHA